MTNIETIITLDDISEFFRELKEMHRKRQLPSDEVHFGQLEEIFRLAGKGDGWDSETVFQLLNHYRIAEEKLRRDGEPIAINLGRVSKCMNYARQKGEEISPAILYGVVKVVINYGIIISPPVVSNPKL